jgi:hypothetical protein
MPAVWALSVLVAVLVDPHLVDYDLSVLVAAGVIAAPLVPRLAWLVVPLYPISLLRAQIPLGEASLQLTAPLLVWCAFVIVREITRGPGSAHVSGTADVRHPVVQHSQATEGPELVIHARTRHLL